MAEMTQHCENEPNHANSVLMLVFSTSKTRLLVPLFVGIQFDLTKTWSSKTPTRISFRPIYFTAVIKGKMLLRYGL